MCARRISRGCAGGEQVGVGHERRGVAAVGEERGIPPAVLSGFDQCSTIVGRVARGWVDQRPEADQTVVNDSADAELRAATA